jgi:hypothetical protein
MKVEIKRTELEYDGFVKVEKAVLRYERFSGGMTADITRHRFSRGDAVGVLIRPVSASCYSGSFVTLRIGRWGKGG